MGVEGVVQRPQSLKYGGAVAIEGMKITRRRRRRRKEDQDKRREDKEDKDMDMDEVEE